MSSCDRVRRRLLAGGLASAVAPLAAGCGFRPLYGTGQSSAGDPDTELAAISIRGIEGRTGQQLHNLLRDRLTPEGQPIDPAYALHVSVTVATRELSIQKDETATRANLILTAKFRLNRLPSGQSLVLSSIRTVNSYNILDAFYASVVSRQDATERGLRELADGIARRLAQYFADPERDASA